jgi:cold shock CspA family protein
MALRDTTIIGTVMQVSAGKLIKLVHLSQQRYLPNTRLVPDHNDKGYGIIEDEQGGEVYFSHEVVENRFGFDDLRKGQQLEYTLENASYLRAASVRVAPAVAVRILRPAA